MHQAARWWVEQWRGPDVDGVLEFGGRDVNGGVRDVWPEAARYVGVDVQPGPGVDVVGDAGTVDCGHGMWDVVVCCEVLEHVDDETAEAICANAWVHLRDGGRLIVTAAGPGRVPHSAIDGGPLRPGESYRNVDRVMLGRWLSPFASSLIVEADGDVRAVAWR